MRVLLVCHVLAGMPCTDIKTLDIALNQPSIFCCQGCARLLLRCARRADTDFPAHAAELTSFAVAACARAGMRASAFELAAAALRAPWYAELAPALRRRLEAVVRRRNRCVTFGARANMPCGLTELQWFPSRCDFACAFPEHRLAYSLITLLFLLQQVLKMFMTVLWNYARAVRARRRRRAAHAYTAARPGMKASWPARSAAACCPSALPAVRSIHARHWHRCTVLSCLSTFHTKSKQADPYFCRSHRLFYVHKLLACQACML